MKRSLAILVGTLVLLMSIHVWAGDEELYGTWRLVSFTQTIVATGETTDIFEHHGASSITAVMAV